MGEETIPMQREERERGRLRRGGCSYSKQREVRDDGRRSAGWLK